ncbi:MAG: hypothetical protein U0935_02960 [Pirellulales bacterium]
MFDPFHTRDTFSTSRGPIGIYRSSGWNSRAWELVSAIPFSIRILLEAVLRNCDGYVVTEENVRQLAAWQAAAPAKVEILFQRES